MGWPSVPWSTPGNWYSQEGQASTRQAQSALASATIQIAGPAQTAQQGQGIVGAGSDVRHIIGSVYGGQGSQQALAQGAPRINGAASITQRSQSVSATGTLTITGSASTRQAQSAKGAIFKDPVAINVALKRMLDYPHSAVFDKAPDEQQALRLSAPGSLTWRVDAGVLTVTVDGFARKYALRNITFDQLVSALTGDGVTVIYQNPDYSDLGAHMLLDGSGDQSQSNGNRLMAYSSDLWAFFSAYSVEIDLLSHQLLEALKQMIITKAQDEWLDLWGKLYNHPRSQGKRDIDYAPEIPREAFRERVNAIAIEKAILELTGKDVIIEEPWDRLFRLDFSRLSGGDRFYDGTSTGYHLIRPVSPYPIDWTDVIPVIKRNKAAGVIMLEPETRLAIGVSGGIRGNVNFARTDIYADLVEKNIYGRLDFMRLSVAEPIRRNYEVMISSINTYASDQGTPVSVSLQWYSISGLTWRDPNTWGDFTWNGDGAITSSLEVDGTVSSAGASYDIDIVEV